MQAPAERTQGYRLYSITTASCTNRHHWIISIERLGIAIVAVCTHLSVPLVRHCCVLALGLNDTYRTMLSHAGNIPKALAGLVSLEELDLHQNKFYGERANHRVAADVFVE